MLCKHCGADLPEGSTFCNACGTNQLNGTSGPGSHVIISSGNVQGVHTMHKTEEEHGSTLSAAAMVQTLFCCVAAVLLCVYIFSPWTKAKRVEKVREEDEIEHDENWGREEYITNFEEWKRGYDNVYYYPDYDDDYLKVYGTKTEPFWMLLSPYFGFRPGEALPDMGEYPTLTGSYDGGGALSYDELGILHVSEEIFGALYWDLNSYFNDALPEPTAIEVPITGAADAEVSKFDYEGKTYELYFVQNRLVAVRYTIENAPISESDELFWGNYNTRFGSEFDNFNIGTGFSQYEVYQWWIEMNGAKGSFAKIAEYPNDYNTGGYLGPTVITQITSPYWPKLSNISVSYSFEGFKEDQ